MAANAFGVHLKFFNQIAETCQTVLIEPHQDPVQTVVVHRINDHFNGLAPTTDVAENFHPVTNHLVCERPPNLQPKHTGSSLVYTSIQLREIGQGSSIKPGPALRKRLFQLQIWRPQHSPDLIHNVQP